MKTFFKVIDGCFTENQIQVLRFALRSGSKVYLYGHGLGKSLLAETFRNAGYDVHEPGECEEALGPMEVHDVEGTIAFCVRNTPKERIPGIFEILLGCSNEIREWVNQ